MSFPVAVRDALVAGGFLLPEEQPVMHPLKGGVSSDIWSVETARGVVCVKMALPTLKVARQWQAPVERNGYEALWLQQVHEWAPESVPEVLFHDDERKVLVLEYLPASQYRNWKADLLRGQTDRTLAQALGALLAQIHDKSHGDDRLAQRFATGDLFFALRLEPYFLSAAEMHPDVAPALEQLVADLETQKVALVHGDISPKNILARDSKPVILDAETAWFGEPAFDVAFCLTHLLLKMLHCPEAAAGLADGVTGLWEAYSENATYRPLEETEAWVVRLVPALMLARIDGKSPVEYLVDQLESQQGVREFAKAQLRDPDMGVGSLLAGWQSFIE